ncbi:iminosuccinate reductase BhcD [Neoaquamicrobium sediminum]|uniref:iminosuccinate reductase BhcD n=1 Tax=Neoaquamicrobium sediminum TaxID=1849104 RepID=UPI00360A108B
MIIVPERLIAGLVSETDVFNAVEKVFVAMARGQARNFPVVREAIGCADALYGIKAGFDQAGLALGLKAGGYWPSNITRGITNHQSIILLFDPETGQVKAAVGGNLLTALRTAAASAVSINHLARRDARVLGIVGAGHQSVFQMRGAARVRTFDKVIAWNRQAEKLSKLADAAAALGLPFEAADLARLGAEADVIITVTSSYAPVLLRDHVRPGTHLACMGTDTKGKQEVEARLLQDARVFTDEVAQSCTIGEAQHAIAEKLIEPANITPLGAVVSGLAVGRTSSNEITVFDGTGVALQDLAVASIAAEAAIVRGLGQEVSI